MSNYDVIITGAGTAGSVLAAGLATRGFKVALLDRQPKEKIGVKVCGDATSTAHFDRIKPIVKIEAPKGDEAAWKRASGTALMAAAKVVAGREGSVELLTKATNCAACHKAHKPS